MALNFKKNKVESSDQFTDLLRQWQGGSRSAYDRLFSIAYGEITRIAQRKLRAERGPLTLRTSDLVHETFLKMMHGYSKVQWKNRSHFMNSVARAMFQILMDYMRAKKTRPQGRPKVMVEDMDKPGHQTSMVHASGEMQRGARIDLWRAVNRLGKVKPRWRLISMMRLMGMNHEEIADSLGLSIPTVKREWKLCREVLECELRERLRRNVFKLMDARIKDALERDDLDSHLK